LEFRRGLHGEPVLVGTASSSVSDSGPLPDEALKALSYINQKDAYIDELEAALNEIVDVLGCGGNDRFVPAFDPHQDNDRAALAIAKRVLSYDAT
jgi:hypothetical protein